MKAEHRKELHTNALADRMGRMVTRMKAKPDRRAFLWIVLGVAVVAVLIGWFYYQAGQRALSSRLWDDVNEARFFFPTRNNKLAPSELLTEYKETKPGQVARFQLAWTYLWEGGIKMLEANPTLALGSIKDAERRFEGLASECKEDPVLGPEALYALAVIEETQAVDERDRIDKAITRYRAVERSFKESAAGKAAAARADYLEKNRPAVREFYADLQQGLQFFRMQEKLNLPPPTKGPEKVMPKVKK